MSVVGNLLLMSVEQGRGRTDCGLQGVAEDISPERFRGLRIFDISDITRPRQVGQVQTCRGSHTHSVVKGPRATAGSWSIIRAPPGCARARNWPAASATSRATTAPPCSASTSSKSPSPIPPRRGSSPARRVFADEAGRLAGLWQGRQAGRRRAGHQRHRPVPRHHRLPDAASSPRAPARAMASSSTSPTRANRKRIDVVSDPGFAYWHSATFNNDGTKVLFTDEWGGGGRPRCRSFDPPRLGRRRDLRHRGRQADAQGHLQAARAADRAGKLRRAQRLDHPGAGPRYHGPGLVSGRHVDVRFHRQRARRSRSPISTAARSTPSAQVARRLLVGLLLSRADLRHRDRARARRVRAEAERAC